MKVGGRGREGESDGTKNSVCVGRTSYRLEKRRGEERELKGGCGRETRKVRASPGRWALPARCLSVKGGASLSGWLLQGWGGAREEVQGQGNWKACASGRWQGIEEDEGMGEELEPEAWRQDRACW